MHHVVQGIWTSPLDTCSHTFNHNRIVSETRSYVPSRREIAAHIWQNLAFIAKIISPMTFRPRSNRNSQKSRFQHPLNNKDHTLAVSWSMLALQTKWRQFYLPRLISLLCSLHLKDNMVTNKKTMEKSQTGWWFQPICKLDHFSKFIGVKLKNLWKTTTQQISEELVTQGWHY